MNNLKFRAWDALHNEMVYSDQEDTFYINTKGVLFMYAIPKSESGIGATIYHKDYNVMQYTGKVDCSGVNIYDGDIVDLGQTVNGCNTFIVFWDEERLGWSVKYGCDMATPRNYEYDLTEFFAIDEYTGEGLKVIGNIYEDRELLGQE